MRRYALLTLAHGARSAGLAATFAGALVLGLSLHANTPAVRRVAADIGNRVTGGLFTGKVAIGEVQSLSLGRTSTVRVREAEVTDPRGRRVILANDIVATIDLGRLLWSLQTGPADVQLDAVSVAKAEVVLDKDTDGTPWIARTFAARESSTTKSEPSRSPGAGTGRKVRVALDGIRLGQAQLRGDLVPPSLDGDATDLRGRFRLEDERIRVTVERGRVALRAPKLPSQREPLLGDVRGELAIAPEGDHPLHGKVRLDGSCGSVRVVAEAELAGDRVSATIDVPRTEPAALGAALGDVLPLTRPLEVHAHAEGKLPTIGLTGRVNVGDAQAELKGEIDTREGRAFKLEVDAARVDAQAFGASIATQISGRLVAEGNLEGQGGPFGTVRVTTTEGTVGTEKIPAATLEGRFEPRLVTAVLRAEEPGVQANGTVALDVPTRIATIDLQARSASLRALARAPNKVAGAASARVRGKIDLRQQTVHATTVASADNVAFDTFSASHVSANGVIDGPLASPIVVAGFAGTDLRMKANGKAPLVYPSATGHAKLAIVPTPRLFDVSLELAQSGGEPPVAVSAREIQLGRGIETRGVRVSGLGEPVELDARLGNGEWHVRAKSGGLDLRRAVGITGIKELALLPEDTRAAVDVDVRGGVTADRASGHIDVVLRTEKGIGSGPIAFETHATIRRGKLVGTSKLDATGIGHVEIARAEIDVPARVDARSLARATGIVDVRGAIDLSQGAALFGGESVERVAGVVSFDGRLERRDPNAAPVIRATARSAGLEVVLTGEPPSRSVEIKGVDGLAHVAWDGSTDDAELAVLSWDGRGLLGSAGVKGKVPLLAWLKRDKPVTPRDLATLEMNAVADVPSRDFNSMPAFLDPPPLRGQVGAHAEASGTVEHPEVLVSARAKGLRGDRRRGAPATSMEPVDGTLEARWDGERAAITFALDERVRRERARRAVVGGRRVLLPPTTPKKTPEPGRVRGLVLLTELNARDLLEGKPVSALPWRASAEVELEQVDLGAIPTTLTSTRLAGKLTGRARVRDLNHATSFEAKAHVDGFGAGGAKVQNADFTIGGRDGSLFAHASVTDRESRATFQLASTSLHVKGIDVSWDESAGTRVDYAVQNGRLALLAPVVRRIASEIDGRVDGAGSVTLQGGSQVFEGGLAVTNARVYLNLLGEEVSALDAVAKFERNGTFRIEGASGRLGAGEFRASASGRMKGLRFEGGDATIVASKDGVPISSEGATYADATGEVQLSAKMTPDRSAVLIDMTVPRAKISLPDSTQTLQPLDPDPTVTVGVRRQGKLDTTAARRSRGGTGRSARAEDALVTRMSVVLGDAVRLEGRGLDVQLTGKTLVEISDELKVTGRIDLRGGSLEVQGRSFTVDRGTVTFPDGGDPANPTIVAAAYWDAPDRTRVWAEYTGPLKGGKLDLRSEPAYSRTEILSLLLFGRPDPNMAAAGATAEKPGDASGGATAVGTGFFAADFNRALASVDPNLDFETDTLSGNRTRYKFGKSFFDRRLKVQVAPAPGRVTYRDPDSLYLFLNWQFVPKWSLLGTGGNTGTTIVDVLFQHRY